MHQSQIISYEIICYMFRPLTVLLKIKNISILCVLFVLFLYYVYSITAHVMDNMKFRIRNVCPV